MSPPARLPALAALLVALGSAAVWMLPAEIAARCWIARRGDPLDRAMTIVELDAHLGWRQRPGLDCRFYGQRLRTNERGLRNPPLAEAAAARRRVLVLGPSSTFGWGVAENATYARRLERLLRQEPGSRGAVAVVNAGQIGYSVWQGLELYRSGELRSLRPDVVVIAYGLNDMDRYRFAFNSPEPDAAALGRGQNPVSVRLQNLLSRLQFLQLSRRHLLFWAGRLFHPASAAAWTPHGLRVPVPDFEGFLLELVRLVRADGARVILLTSAYRIPADSPPADAGDLRSRINAEPWRIHKDLEALNARVLAVARREGLPAVDVARLLEGTDAQELFVDPAHPSDQGHALIARALLRAIQENCPSTSSDSGRPGAPAGPSADVARGL